MRSRSKFVVVVMASAVMAFRAEARIGETLEQCTIRYGAPVTKSNTNAVFIKAGFAIAVMFYEGKVDSLGITKIEKDALGKSIEMSENEISQLLRANSGDRKWKEISHSFERSWLTEDAQIVAIYGPSTHLLTIMTKDSAERAAAARKTEEDKKLNGF